jgi:16S rRNA processing protein RimM
MSQDKEIHKSERPAGSPPSGEPDFLVVGKLRRTHGLQGELLMEVLTDFPERLEPGVVVYVGQKHRKLHIRSQRFQNQHLLIAFDEFNTPESAAELRNQLVFVHAGDRPPLPEGEYYHHQLLGLRVVSDEAQDLGILDQILETGANDVYVVVPEAGPELLLPAIESVILNIDLDRGEICVHLLPGMLPK